MRSLFILTLVCLLPALEGATITGRLVTGEDDKPKPGIEVELREAARPGQEGEVWTGETDDDGRFRWNDAPARTFRLRILSDGWAVALHRQDVEETDESSPRESDSDHAFFFNGYPRADANRGNVDFGDVALVPGGSMKIKIVDEQSREVSGEVTVYRGRYETNFHVASGPNVVVPALPVGSYWVFCQVKSKWSCAKMVVVEHGRQTEETFVVMERMKVELNVSSDGTRLDKYEMRAVGLHENGIADYAEIRARDGHGYGVEVYKSRVPLAGSTNQTYLARGSWYLDFRAEGCAPQYLNREFAQPTEVVDVELSQGVNASMRMSGPARNYGSFVLVDENSPALEWAKSNLDDLPKRLANRTVGLGTPPGIIMGQWRGKETEDVLLSPGRYWAAAWLNSEGGQEVIDMGVVDCPDEALWELEFEGATNSLELALTYNGEPLADQRFELWAGYEDERGHPDGPYHLVESRTDNAGVATVSGLGEYTYGVLLDFEAVQLREHNSDFGPFRYIPIRQITIARGANSAVVEVGEADMTWIDVQVFAPEEWSLEHNGYRHLDYHASMVQFRNDEIIGAGEALKFKGYVYSGDIEFGFQARRSSSSRHGHPIDTVVPIEASGMVTRVHHKIETHSIGGRFRFPRDAEHKSVEIMCYPGHAIHTDIIIGSTFRASGDDFELDQLPEGDYVIRFSHEGVTHFEEVTLDRDVRNLRVSFTGSTGRAKVTISASEEARSIHPLRVRLFDRSGQELSGVCGSLDLPEIGTPFLLVALEPGSYTLEASTHGFGTETTNVRVRRDNTTDVEMTMKLSATIAIEISANFGVDSYVRQLRWEGEDADGNRIPLRGWFERGYDNVHMSLPLDCVCVHVRCAGHEAVTIDVDPSPGTQITEEVRLEPSRK